VVALDQASRALGDVQGQLGGQLVFVKVPVTERLAPGDTVVTAGSQSGQLQSLFPRRIPICTVTSVSQRDIDSYKQIQCTPLVDFDAVHEVIVLVGKGSR